MVSETGATACDGDGGGGYGYGGSGVRRYIEWALMRR